MQTTYRKAYEVIGFTYWADLYCLKCGENLPEHDPEGNTKYPVFLCNVDDLQGYTCCECDDDVADW